MTNAYASPELKEPDRLRLQAAKLAEILDVVVSDFFCEEMVSDEIACN